MDAAGLVMLVVLLAMTAAGVVLGLAMVVLGAVWKRRAVWAVGAILAAVSIAAIFLTAVRAGGLLRRPGGALP